MAENKAVKNRPTKKRVGNVASVGKAAEASARSAKERAEYRRRAGNAKELRQSLLDSWNRVSGPSKLIKLAQDDFPTYLRLVLQILPKQSDMTIQVQRMSDEELKAKIDGLLTEKVLNQLGYAPIGSKALAAPSPPASLDAPAVPSVEPADRLAQ